MTVELSEYELALIVSAMTAVTLVDPPEEPEVLLDVLRLRNRLDDLRLNAQKP